MTHTDNAPPPVPGATRAVLCLLWVTAVTGAFCVAYGATLLEYARTAADRLPLVARILELLNLGA